MKWFDGLLILIVTILSVFSIYNITDYQNNYSDDSKYVKLNKDILELEEKLKQGEEQINSLKEENKEQLESLESWKKLNQEVKSYLD